MRDGKLPQDFQPRGHNFDQKCPIANTRGTYDFDQIIV